ncbi:hypothetical protein J6590_042940 [Homalodisca vitripennis]|nr:hypothetical protein J6590_042940 [Homalodisca vitripennis]
MRLLRLSLPLDASPAAPVAVVEMTIDQTAHQLTPLPQQYCISSARQGLGQRPTSPTLSAQRPRPVSLTPSPRHPSAEGWIRPCPLLLNAIFALLFSASLPELLEQITE